jgi:bacteriocin-like protein
MTITINASAARERENQTGELTEAELSKVIGGSQSSGAGAGKISFNPFSITRKIDAASPIFFQ